MSVTIYTSGAAIQVFKTDPPPVPNNADADWLARKNTAGLIRAQDFDSDIALTTTGHEPFGLLAGSATNPTRDKTVKASGLSSLRFDIPSLSGENAAGAFYMNFSDDLSVQVGAGEKVYVQFRWRCNQALLDTVFLDSQGNRQAGMKLCDLTAGYQAGPPPLFFYSSGDAKLILQGSYQNKFPILYAYNKDQANTGYTQTINGDIGLQNMMPAPFCTYGRTRDAQGHAIDGPIVGCFNLVADEWMTFEEELSLGPLGTDANGNVVWTQCVTKLWGAREGQPPTLIIDFNPSVDGYFDHKATDTYSGVRYPVKIGQMLLLPFMTDKNVKQAHPLCHVWNDEALVARNPIAFPGGFPIIGGTVPTTPTNLQASDGVTPVTVTWDPSASVFVYNAYRSAVAGQRGTLIGTSTTPSFTDTPPNGGQFFYTVTASNDVGPSPDSNQDAGSLAPSGGGANPVFDPLPDNTVMDLGPFVCINPDPNSFCKSVTAFSGMRFDRNRRRMVIFGGGHDSTNYDSLLCFSMDSLTYVEEYPATPSAFLIPSNYDADKGAWLSGPTGPYPRPAARHSTSQMIVLGDEFILTAGVEGDFGLSLGPGWPNIGDPSLQTASIAKVSHYNFISKTWSFSPTARNRERWPGVAFDPVSWLIVSCGQLGMDFYDPVTKTRPVPLLDLNNYTIVQNEAGTWLGNPLTFGNNLVHFPPNGKFYYFDCGHATGPYIYEWTQNRSDHRLDVIKRLNITGAAMPTPEMGWAYDSKNQVIGAGPVAGKFYTFDPLTKVLTANTIQGGVPDDVSFHAIDYDDINNVFVSITGAPYATRTWAYRYKR